RARPADQPAPAAFSAPPAAAGASVLAAPALAEWRAILTRVAARHAATASVYEHAAPLEIVPGRIVLGYEPGTFLASQAARAEALALLAAEADAHLGVPTRIELDHSGAHRGVPTVAACNAAEQQARRQAAERAVAEHPLVAAAVKILGAELLGVRLPEGRTP
ncbi:MAG: DNA polymerase III subunit gamma/tau, partial [Deltaproteobacteria bacterium]|nr:DNA polymerase III subunit gamma/tau [Deltaproteobacteria bacterium]